MTTTATARLTVALGCALLPPRTPELRLLHSWLDTWSGIGAIADGMHRQGYDLQLTQYDDRGWRATFYVSVREHSPVAATG